MDLRKYIGQRAAKRSVDTRGYFAHEYILVGEIQEVLVGAEPWLCIVSRNADSVVLAPLEGGEGDWESHIVNAIWLAGTL